MATVLGISAFYHDSAAALVVDGQIVAAAQEERFTRRKHDSDFRRTRSSTACEARLRPEHLDYVGFYDKPLSKFERLLETYLAFAPAGYRSFRAAMPLWLKQKLHLPEMNRGCGRYRNRYVFTDHHESQRPARSFRRRSTKRPSSPSTASASGPPPASASAAATASSSPRDPLSAFARPAVLGLHLLHGLPRQFSGEYKLMGLAPYGEPELPGPDPRRSCST